MLSGVLIVLILIIALLVIPVSLIFNVSRQHEFISEFKLGWMFGLIHVRLGSQQKKTDPSARKKDRNDKPVKQSAGKHRGRSAIRLIFNKALRQRLFKYISDVWRSIKKENIDVYIRAGLEDPADTGQLWAFVGPVAGTLANSQQHSINIQANFLNAGFELESKGALQFSPLKIILVSFGLLLSPIIWRAGHQLITGQ